MPGTQLLLDNLLLSEVSSTLVAAGTLAIAGRGPFSVQFFQYSVDLVGVAGLRRRCVRPR